MRQIHGRGRSTGIVLLAFLAMASACKSKKDEAGTGTGGPDPSSRRTVRIPSNEPKYLNPLLEARFVIANSLIFEGLVGLDAKMEPVPHLARSWTMSDDGRTITFALRDDVTWHDGKPFTSADVAFTLDAIRSVPAATAWKTYMAPIESLTTPDDHTVVVTYTAPFAPALATWTVGILPKHAFPAPSSDGKLDLASAPANSAPIGTGPFKFVNWDQGKLLVLAANPTWWSGKPKLEKIELVLGVLDHQVIDMLRGDQIDLARIGDVDTWLSATNQPGFSERFEASEIVEPRIRLIAWNTRRGKLSDARVRKALTLALDRNSVITDVLRGQAQALSAPLFPTLFGYDPSVAPLPYDLEAARALLDEAAPLQGDARFTIELISVDSLGGPATTKMFDIFEESLAKLGITLHYTTLPSREYYERVVNRDFDAVYFGWLPDIADPDPAGLLHSSQAGLGANYADYSNPEVDKLLEVARTTVDRDQRKKYYEQLQRLLNDEMPYTPLFAPFSHYAWNRRLRGVAPRDVTPQAALPGIAGWSIGDR